MRYRIFLTIKLLISSVEVQVVGLAVYFYIYVCLLMLTWLPEMAVLHVFSCIKTCIVSTVWQEIVQSFDPHLQPFSIHNAFINSGSSTVNGIIIYVQVTSFLTLYCSRA